MVSGAIGVQRLDIKNKTKQKLDVEHLPLRKYQQGKISEMCMGEDLAVLKDNSSFICTLYKTWTDKTFGVLA